MNKEGYSNVRVNKEIHRTDEKISLERYKKHDIDIVIDTLDISEKERLAEITFKEIEEDGMEILHTLKGCYYTDVKGVVHIECKTWSDEIIEK